MTKIIFAFGCMGPDNKDAGKADSIPFERQAKTRIFAKLPDCLESSTARE
jgi:hypothetical protein